MAALVASMLIGSCDVSAPVIENTAQGTPEPEAHEPGEVVIRNFDLHSINIEPVGVHASSYSIVYISFDTDVICSTVIEVDGQELLSQNRTRHNAMFTTRGEDISYSIHSIVRDDILNEDVINLVAYGIVDASKACTMFYYSGDYEKCASAISPVVWDIDWYLGGHCGDLDITLLCGADDDAFDKAGIFTFEEKTSSELYESARNAYEVMKPKLSSMWDMMSDAEIEMSYYMNVVNWLWHFGNFKNIHETGCLQVNEEIDATEGERIYSYMEDGTPLYWRTAIGMSDYLKSDIGCCIDQAFLLKVLLDEAGYQTRRLITIGHWVTEVFADSSWYTIDSTAGVLIKGSVEDMQGGQGRSAYLFYSPYMDSSNEMYYSTLIYPRFAKYTMGIGLEYMLEDIAYIYGYLDQPDMGYYEIDQINGL